MTLPNSSKRKVFDGRYEILSIVGRGADSVVYHARHISAPTQEVAIKVLVNRDGSSKLTDKLRKEALTLVSCRQKYVVRLDDFHSIKDLCYLSMEFAAHGDLVKYVKSNGNKLPVEQATRFLKQALEGLDFVHATGVIHRDLKPENILVMNDKEIRLADFGLALLPGDELSIEELRKAAGTFAYLAPEVLDGVRCDTVSDLYSLGISFYELIGGVHPFASAPLASQREARQDRNIKPLKELAPDLPEHVSAVIHQMIRFDPEHRFQSAMDALQALANEDFRGYKGLLDNTPSETSVAAVGGSNPTNTNSDPLFVAEPSRSSQAVEKVAEPIPSATSPANSDTVEPRSSQPTETIDLERIKSIIARETQRSGSEHRANPANEAKNPTERSQRRSELPTSKQRKNSSLGLLAAAWSAFYGLPGFIRPIAIAGLSAILTIGTLMAWNTIFDSSKRGQRSASASTVAIADGSNLTDNGSEQPAEGSAVALRQLPEGIYTGAISGLIPGSNVPLAILSQPEQGQLTLIVGIEGWLPATANTVEQGEDGSQAVIFRSNGMILRFDQELPSQEITGNIVDVVTGETGRWKLIGNS